MTEDEAREWIIGRFGEAAFAKLETFEALLRAEAAVQNLVAPSTLDHIWVRHFVDSAQLLDHAQTDSDWLDVGSGAGLPGIVLAVLIDAPIELVEPRPLRTAFLQAVATNLGLTNATVVTAKVERTHGIASLITARAVSNVSALFRSALHRANESTIWILPKGRNAETEVEVARHSWHGVFHVKPSMTAPDSLIVVAQGVRPR